IKAKFNVLRARTLTSVSSADVSVRTVPLGLGLRRTTVRRRGQCTSWESVVMKNFVARFVKDESGATAIEYGLIAALIAVGIIGAARLLGSQISTTFNTVTSEMAKG